MQSIKVILPILFMFCFSNVFAQDEIYNEKKPKKEKKVILKKSTEAEEVIDFEAYATEQDYNQSKRIAVDPDRVKRDDDYWEEEIYNDDNERERKRDNRGGEIAAQIIFDVVVNTVFIIAAFWN